MPFVTLPSPTRITDNTGTNIAALASGLPIPNGTFGLVVYNIPSGTQTIIGDVNVSGITGKVSLSGIIDTNIVSSVPIAISNLPAVQTVQGIIIISGVVNQGSPTTVSSGWPVKITDGVNVLGVVSHPVIVSGLVDEIQLPYISGVLTVTSDAPVVFQIPPGYQTLYLNNFTSSGRLDAYLDSLGNNQIPSYVHDGGTGLTQGYPLFIPLERVYDLNTFDNSIIPVGGLSELFFFDSNSDSCNFLLSPQKFNATSDFYLQFLFNWLTNTLSPLPKIDINTMPNVIVSGVTTANQGSPTTVASGWPVKITDGTNVLGTATNPIVTSGTFINRIIQPIAISGVPTVSVSNFPNPITVNGSVTLSGAPVVTVSGTVNADIINFPASQNVVVTSMPSPVTVNGAITISGDPQVIANQGSPASFDSNAWLVNVRLSNTDSGSSPSASPGNATVVAGQFNTTLPTFTNAQAGAIQVDSRGRVLVNGAISISGTPIVNIGTMPNITVSGVDITNQGSPAPISSGWPIKITDGINTALVDSNGNLKVDVSGWFNSSAPTVGSKTSANSIPVVIASDQASIPITINALNAVFSTVNNTTTPLTANSVFNGSFENVSQFASLLITADSDQQSASGGLALIWSTDGVNTDFTENNTFNAGGNGLALIKSIRAKFFKLQYTNGTSDQTFFRLQILELPSPVSIPTYPLSDNIAKQEVGAITKSVLMAQAPAGNFKNLQQNSAQDLLVALDAAIPAGTNVIGHVVTDTGSTTSVSNFPNPLTVNGAVSISGSLPAGTNVIGHVIVDSTPSPITVNGSVTISGTPSVSISSLPNETVNQGVPAVIGSGWPIKITDGVNTAALASGAPLNAAQGLVTRSFVYGLVGVTPTVLSITGSAADAASNVINGVNTVAYNSVFNGTSWDRMIAASGLSGTTTATILPNLTGSAVGVPAQLIMGYDSTGGANAYRAIKIDNSGSAIVRGGSANVSDAFNPGAASVVTNALAYVTNGSTWDRAIGASGLSGATTTTVLPSLTGSAVGMPTHLIMGLDNTNNAQAYRAIKADTNGNLHTALYNPNGTLGASVSANSDAQISTLNGLSVIPYTMVFNGTTWDRSIAASGLTGTTSTIAMPSFTKSAVGMQTHLNMGFDSTTGAQAYRAVSVDTTGAQLIGYARPTTDPYSEASFNTGNVSGATTIVAGVGGQTIRVYRSMIFASGNTQLTMNSTSTFAPVIPMTANGGYILDLSNAPWFTTPAGSGFAINSSATTTITGGIYYTQS